jgi:hypothetical protein
MPVSSLSSLNSWGTYIIAGLALMLVLAPTVESAAYDSREGVDYRNADGVRAVIDSLRPGVSVSFTFGSSSSNDPLRVVGDTIVVSYGRGTVSLQTTWTLPNETLFATVAYVASIDGGVAEVSRSV